MTVNLPICCLGDHAPRCVTVECTVLAANKLCHGSLPDAMTQNLHQHSAPSSESGNHGQSTENIVECSSCAFPTIPQTFVVAQANQISEDGSQPFYSGLGAASQCAFSATTKQILLWDIYL